LDKEAGGWYLNLGDLAFWKKGSDGESREPAHLSQYEMFTFSLPDVYRRQARRTSTG
jgi:hypothetical protein